MKNKTTILKVSVAGEYSAGKSSLLDRIAQDRFDHGYGSMMWMNYFTQNYHIDEKMVEVQYWDDAGTERYLKLRSPLLKTSQVILLCFSLNDPQTFERAICWLHHIREMNQDCTFYLIGCKCDLEQNVRQESILRFARKQEIEYFKCSAKQNIGIRPNFDRIVYNAVTRLLNNPEKIVEKSLLHKAPPSRPQPSSSSCRT